MSKPPPPNTAPRTRDQGRLGHGGGTSRVAVRVSEWRDLLDHLGAELALEQLGAAGPLSSASGSSRWASASASPELARLATGSGSAARRPGRRRRRAGPAGSGAGSVAAVGRWLGGAGGATRRGCRRCGGGSAGGTGRRSTRSASRRRRRRSAPAAGLVAPPLAKESRRAGVGEPEGERAWPSTPTTWAFWVSWIQATRRRSLVASTTSGHSRRTSTSVQAIAAAPAAPAAGSGSGAARGSGSVPAGRLGARRLGSGSRLAGSGSGPPRARPPARARRLGARPPARRGRWPGGGAGLAARRPALGVPPVIAAASRAGRAGPATRLGAWSAPGSSTRAQISSSSSRGAVAPRISVSPVATRSAARLSSAGPNRAACATSRSPWSSGTSISPVAGASGTRRDDHQVAQPAQQVLGEPPRVLPGLDHLVDHAEDRGAVAGGERVDHLVEQRRRACSRAARWPGRRSRRRGRRRRAAGRAPTGCRAPTRRRPGRPAAARPARSSTPSLLAELGEVRRQQPRREQPERVVVGARPDGRDHLVGLGRGEDEPQVRRRLLDQLEQGVEALRA